MIKPFTFPYKRFFGDFYPIIKIEIKGSRGVSSFEAYVDSGASTSIFDAAVASQIGINYTKGKRRLTMVGNGAYIPIYICKVPIKIGDIWIKTTVGFSPDFGASMNLLGQKDIFDHFDITFSKSKGKVLFHPVIDKENDFKKAKQIFQNPQKLSPRIKRLKGVLKGKMISREDYYL